MRGNETVIYAKVTTVYLSRTLYYFRELLPGLSQCYGGSIQEVGEILRILRGWYDNENTRGRSLVQGKYLQVTFSIVLISNLSTNSLCVERQFRILQKHKYRRLLYDLIGLCLHNSTFFCTKVPIIRLEFE